MVNFTTGQGITLKHMVVYENGNKLFAAGREDFGDKHLLRLYLLDRTSGEVYTRNGRTETWNNVSGEYRQHIVKHIHSAEAGRAIPVYRIQGAFNI